MKFWTIAFCICILQIYSINGETSYIEGNFREYLGKMQGVSEQFLNDVDKINEKYKDDAFVMGYLNDLAHIIGVYVNETKITISSVTDYLKKHQVSAYDVIDNADIFKVILSRKLPSERFNGILSLAMAFRPDAANEEIEKALGYLYGSETSPPQPNIPALDTMNCSTESTTEFYAALNTITMKKFRQIKDIRPNVIQDLTSIFEKFPCNKRISISLNNIADRLVDVFNGDGQRINSCVIKEKPINFLLIGNIADSTESTLSARLPREKYGEMIDSMKKLYRYKTDEEIGHVFTYLYGTNVEPTSC